MVSKTNNIVPAFTVSTFKPVLSQIGNQPVADQVQNLDSTFQRSAAVADVAPTTAQSAPTLNPNQAQALTTTASLTMLSPGPFAAATQTALSTAKDATGGAPAQTVGVDTQGWNTPDYESMFTMKATELAPMDLAGISQMAQSRDVSTDPVNQEADKLSTQILGDFRDRAAATRSRLVELNKAGEVPVYEVGVVGGAGIHGAELITALEALAPNAKIIGIDAGNGTSKTFDSDYFHLNSSNGPDLDDTPLLYAPNQLRNLMPEVPGHLYPRARALANGNHNELGAMDADFLLGKGVASAKRDADGLFTITDNDGVQVRVRKLVTAVGYGATKTNFMDADSQAFVKDSIDQLHQGKTQGLAVGFDDLRRQIETDGTGEHRLDGMDKIVVGGGDGGAVVVEHETGEGRSGQMFWLGQQGTTGSDYIANVKNKKRYGDLVPRVDSGEVKDMPGHLHSLKQIEVNGKTKVEASYSAVDGTEQKVVADVAILAAGYDASPNVFGEMAPHYFANNQDPELKGVWDLAKSREKDFGTNHPELAGKETPGFYSVGVNGFKATGMPSVAPGSGVTVQIAKELASDVQVQREVIRMPQAPGVKSQLSLDTSKIASRNIQEPKIALAGAKTEFLRQARLFSFESPLSFSVQKAGDKVTLGIEGVASEASNAMLKKLSGSEAFVGYLKDAIPTSGSLSLNIPNTDGGGLRMDRAQVVSSS